MALAPKVLGQVAPAATTWTDLYVSPTGTGKSAAVSVLSMANRGAVDSKVRIAVRPGGAALDPKHYELYDFVVPAYDRFAICEGWTLEATDVVSVYGETANMTFALYGVERTP